MSISKTNRSSSLISIALLISPFLIYLGINNPYEFPKFVFFLIFSQGLAIYLFIKIKKIKLDLLTKLIILFLCVTFIANILGLDPKISLLGSEWRHQGFLLLIACFIFYLASKTIKNPKLITKSIIISSIFLSTISITELILLELGFYFPTYNGRIVATLGNPNFVGGYIAMTLPFLLFYKFKSLLIKLFSIILSITSVLITDSRSSILALIIMLAIFLISKIKVQRKIKYLIFIAFFPMIVFTAYSYSFERNSMWDNRYLIWGEGIRAIAEKPILGYGQENFELIFPKNLDFKVDNAHNIFLETAISTGLIGLLTFLSILILKFKKTNLTIRLSIISFLIVGFFNPLFISAIVLFWVLIGLDNGEDKV